MPKTLYYASALGIGGTISLMVVLNTRFGELATMPVSLLVNQVVGIVAITIIMHMKNLGKGTQLPRQHAPWYLWFGGVFGFFVLNANFVTITNLGASLSMATAVFGQSLGSLIFDLTGFMGRPRYRISRKKTVTLGICLAGIIIMALDGGAFTIPYLILGILTGVVTMVQMVYNSRFGSYKGVLFSARNNVVSGLIFALVVYGFTAFQKTYEGFLTIPSIPLPLVLGGGLLAVVVVTGTNWVIPKIPALYAALLLSSAQIIASMAIDYIIYRKFSIFLLLGAIVVVIGMAGNVLVDQAEARAKSA
jgi:transporter family-2 protein